MFRLFFATACLLMSCTWITAKEPIRLPNRPALSPDGKWLAFDHGGDIWIAPTTGGTAKPLSTHPARDTAPKFSPDGKEVAFVSDRSGSNQIHVMALAGGSAEQVTHHTAGYSLMEWTPDGKGFLVTTLFDHGAGRRNNERIQIVRRANGSAERTADELVFDDYGGNAVLSADGKQVMFTREGMEWWRKGYYGSAASQVWTYERGSSRFTQLAFRGADARWPLYGKNGVTYFVGEKGGCFNLFAVKPGAEPAAVTDYKEDSVVFPCISRDGSVIVFRHLFDFYRLSSQPNAKPEKIELFRDDDRIPDRVDRRVLTTATSVSFTQDGLEIAFIAGGDLWVMDTELKEPKRMTATPAEERQPVFAPDGSAVYFVSEAGGSCEIWRATRADSKRPWFTNSGFNVEKLTADGTEKSRLSFSPDGTRIAYVSGRGKLIVTDLELKNPKTLVDSWNSPDYDWSPDGKWMVYALSDTDFNSDIFILPLDGSKPPFNLSRHPYNDGSPVWSPDGKMIAFIGERDSKDTTDILYVQLRRQDAEKSARDRSLERALEKYLRGKTGGAFPKKGSDARDEDDGGVDDEQVEPEPKKSAPMTPVVGKKEGTAVSIDFDGIRDRIKRVTFAGANESGLFWAPDSKKLAFSATVDGQSGVYTVDLPEGGRPTSISTSSGSGAKWLKNGTVVWLSSGRPASFTPGSAATTAPATTGGTTGGRGTGTTPPGAGSRFGGGASAASPGGYSFTAYQEIDVAKKHQAAFDMAWRRMRDGWYDDRMGNRNWDKVREKYRSMAETRDIDQLTTVIQMMLGELNGSHLGFTATGGGASPARRPGTPEPPATETPADRNWRPQTMHLGVRFDLSHRGEGWKVKDVLPDGPAELQSSRILPGEVILKVDGTAVTPKTDPTTVLNVGPGHIFTLRVSGTNGERDVRLTPMSYSTLAGLTGRGLTIRSMLYRHWLNFNKAQVDKLSNGKFGYLHISAMDMTSFRKFEEELFNAGEGKDGLVIDVRENGGGSTADLLLTALTQPQHAIAVPRNGGPGYPQDRTVFATWTKPIVVLCNQNSFSNAEIFSHAIKNLNRGKVVGVATAGGVISTGATGIMDVGTLRMPFRGWYLINDGQDMELNGAVPHYTVWPKPGDIAAGKDAQMEKAIQVLTADVEAWKARPQPKLKKASER